MKRCKLKCTYRYLWSNYESFRQKYASFLRLWWAKLIGRIDYYEFHATGVYGRERAGHAIIRRYKSCGEVLIEYLDVFPSFRRLGHARDAIRTYMQIYETQGFNRMNVVFDADNAVGVSFFYNLGFDHDEVETSKLAIQRNIIGNNDPERLVMFMTLR